MPFLLSPQDISLFYLSILRPDDGYSSPEAEYPPQCRLKALWVASMLLSEWISKPCRAHLLCYMCFFIIFYNTANVEINIHKTLTCIEQWSPEWVQAIQIKAFLYWLLLCAPSSYARGTFFYLTRMILSHADDFLSHADLPDRTDYFI